MDGRGEVQVISPAAVEPGEEGLEMGIVKRGEEEEEAGDIVDELEFLVWDLGSGFGEWSGEADRSRKPEVEDLRKLLLRSVLRDR